MPTPTVLLIGILLIAGCSTKGACVEKPDPQRPEIDLSCMEIDAESCGGTHSKGKSCAEVGYPNARDNAFYKTAR